MTATRPRIAGVLLASGASSRLGHPKQLIEVEGEPLVRRAARSLLETTTEVAVVLGASADAIAPALADLRLALLHNVDWNEGIASSVRIGIAWTRALSCDAVLLAVCDQLHLGTGHLAQLVASYHGTEIGSRYRGIVGVPAIFPRHMFPALAELSGDRGARALLSGAESVQWDAGALDIDTHDDLASLDRRTRWS